VIYRTANACLGAVTAWKHSFRASPETKGVFLSIPLEFIFILFKVFYFKAFYFKAFYFIFILFLYFWRCGVLFGDGIFRTRSKRSCALGNKTGWGKVTHDASDQRPPIFLAELSMAGLRCGGDGKRKEKINRSCGSAMDLDWRCRIVFWGANEVLFWGGGERGEERKRRGASEGCLRCGRCGALLDGCEEERNLR